MAELPPVRIDEVKLLQKLERISHHQRALETGCAYLAPRTLAQLLSLRAQHPKAQLVAACEANSLSAEGTKADLLERLKLAEITHFTEENA